MKKLLAIVLLSCSTFFANASLTTLDTTSPIVFSTQADGRNWKLGSNVKNDQMTLIEYVVDGESLANWSELVSVMGVWPTEISLEQYYNSFVTSLKQVIPDSPIQTRIIELGPNTLLAEWWLDDKSPNAQHEWIRFFKDQSIIYSLRYTTKKIASVDAKRPIWEKILKEAKIKSPRTQR